MYVNGPSMDVWSLSAYQVERVAAFLKRAEALGLNTCGDTPDGDTLYVEARGERANMDTLASEGYELIPDPEDPEYHDDDWMF